jgi:hypothetical protein
MQAVAFWYWGVMLASGASDEPQVLRSRLQKLVQASPHCGAAALV